MATIMRSVSVIIAVFLSIRAAAAPLQNGGFETVAAGAIPGWRIESEQAEVGTERIRGKWYHFVCDVKPGRFDRIHLHLSFQAAGIGSVWWDNFRSDTLPIRNPDFEELTDDGRLLGWEQDNAGVTIFSDRDRVRSGTRSLRMTRKGGIAPTRVWQVIEVTPGAEYRFEFDLFLSDDFDGRPNIATLTFEEDGKYYGSPMWIRTASWTELLSERAGTSDWVALFQLHGGTAALLQEPEVDPGRNLEARAAVKLGAETSEFALIVEDPEQDSVLGRASISTDGGWQQLNVPFRSDNRRVRIRLQAAGTGEVRIDNVCLDAPALLPPPQQVEWLPSARNLCLTDDLGYAIRGEPGPALDGALELLGTDLGRFGLSLRRAESPAEADLRIRIRPAAAAGDGDGGAEAYRLRVDRGGADIEAATDVGVLRATATLIQLLRQYPDRREPEFAACSIRDYPDMPVRGAFWTPDFQWPEFARRKFNLMYLSTSYWLEWHAFPAELGRLDAYFAEAAKYGIRVLASTGVFQGHQVYTYHDPNLAEGKYIANEELTLTGTEPAALAHGPVLRTPQRGLQLRRAADGTLLELGRDYAVDRGTAVSYPFSAITDVRPDRVRRLPGGRIPDGATVLASYNYVVPSGKLELCMTEPANRQIPGAALAATFRRFPALDLLNLNLDEIAYFRSCGLCRANPKSNDELLCGWIRAMDRAVKQVRPGARLVTWDDMLCPFVDAHRIGIEDPAPLLPADMLLLSWGYNADFPQRYGWPAVRYWSEHDLETLVVPWDNPRNIRAWAQVVAEARRRGWPCSGMLASYWHGRQAYDEAAVCSWRIPRPGEDRFEPVDFRRPVRAAEAQAD